MWRERRKQIADISFNFKQYVLSYIHIFVNHNLFNPQYRYMRSIVILGATLFPTLSIQKMKSKLGSLFGKRHLNFCLDVLVVFLKHDCKKWWKKLEHQLIVFLKWKMYQISWKVSWYLHVDMNFRWNIFFLPTFM